MTERELARVEEGDAVHGTLGEGVDFDGTVGVRGRALDPATGLGTVRVFLARRARTGARMPATP